MSLIKYLITEGKKSVIVNKIGLPPNIAEYSLKYFNKKFVLYWISTLKNLLVASSKNWYEELSSWDYEDFVSKNLITYFKMLEVQMKNPKTPRLPKKILNRFKNKKDFGNISEEIEYIESLVLKYQTIKDYAEATNQNFNNDDFETIAEEAEQWHEELRASGKKLQVSEEQTVIKKFDDGYYWVDLNTNKCYDEGDSMGHCGNTSADTLLSLRDEKGEPHVTVAYNYDGTYRQMKGKGNKKPVKKYHPYIVELFIESHSPTPKEGETNEIYQIINYESEYRPETDFHITDLNDILFKKYKSEVDEIGFISLLEDIDYEILLKNIDYENVNIKIGTKDPRYIKAFTADNYRKDEFIDSLIKFDLLEERYRNIEFIANIQYPNVNIYNKEKVIKELYNDEEIVLLRIMTDYFDEDLFYKRK